MTTQNEQNPYAPPAANIESAGAPVEAVDVAELASRGQRLGGSILDGMIQSLTLVPLFIGTSFAAFGQVSASRPFALYAAAGKWGVVALVLLVAYWAVNWSLLARRGQSIGKIVAGTRVVLVDGSPAPFWRVVALRLWPLIVLGYLPVKNVAPFVMLINVLFIFRRDRRCGHDLVAGTKVVRVGRP